MSSTGIGTAFDSCLKSAQGTDRDLPTEKVVTYCACLVDAWRVNTHAAGDPDRADPPTKEQMKRCGAQDGGSPFAFPFPKGTPDLYRAWQGCLEKSPSRDHGVYCGCYVDGVFKNPTSLIISLGDTSRCDLADQYWSATQKHLTVRQFQLLLGGKAVASDDAGAARDR